MTSNPSVIPRGDPLAREVGYLDLVAGLADEGCTVCNAANRAARAYLDSLLWESVNDPELRPRLRAAHGFCREHTTLALRVAGQQDAGLGIAILYEDFLRNARLDAETAARSAAGPSRTVRRRRRGPATPRPRRACAACSSATATARNCLRLLAVASLTSSIGRRARQAGKGVCLPHLAMGLDEVQTQAQALQLLELFTQVEESLRVELNELIRKRDYRYAQEPRGPEQSSWRRAPYWMVGRPP